MITYERHFSSYNSRRYGKPWGARVTFRDNRPQYEFCGHWDGRAVVIDAQPGEILAFGQKDCRGKNTFRRFYIAQADGELAWATEWDAREHWKQARQALSEKSE